MKSNSRRLLRACICLTLAIALTAAACSYERRPDYYVAAGKLVPVSDSLNESSVTSAAKRFRYLHDMYLAPSHMNVYVAIVPDKGYYLPDSRAELDYSALMEQTLAQMDYAAPIDLTASLSADSYYATDSHWRQECLIGTANTVLSAMSANAGLSGDASANPEFSGDASANPEFSGDALAVEDFTLATAADCFTGSDWRAMRSKGLPMGRGFSAVLPDTLYYLDNDILRQMTVYNYDSGQTTGLYDTKKLSGSNAYDFFLSGPTAILTIDNPAAATDRQLVLLRDSYGSALAPLLAPCYRRILMIDIRYIMSDRLPEQIDFSEWENADALYLYSTTLLNRSISLK
ncbi:MAG: hypothetical protein NC180_11020 [Muribaculaceae bacterium]|nr:hypothetical protein [Roseburia sp.]MCM1432002.1 hypothetical protein [Muribaculaceae bacterium]MCM1493744.1 hypothetical protein [Muribaculaceae bacterium]